MKIKLCALLRAIIPPTGTQWYIFVTEPLRFVHSYNICGKKVICINQSLNFVPSLPEDFKLMMFKAAAFGWDIIGILAYTIKMDNFNFPCVKWYKWKWQDNIFLLLFNI